MLIGSHYQVVTGSIGALSWTHNGVFRRGTTLHWKSYTVDLGIGAPYVWLTAKCPSSGRLFIQPPRYPAPEVREQIRGAVNDSLDRVGINFVWADEKD
jgi:hypothetical protein